MTTGVTYTGFSHLLRGQTLILNCWIIKWRFFCNWIYRFHLFICWIYIDSFVAREFSRMSHDIYYKHRGFETTRKNKHSWFKNQDDSRLSTKIQDILTLFALSMFSSMAKSGYLDRIISGVRAVVRHINQQCKTYKLGLDVWCLLHLLLMEGESTILFSEFRWICFFIFFLKIEE